MKMRKTILMLAALAVAIVAAPSALAKPGPKEKPPKLTTVKLLAFNDFHGHLEPKTPGSISVGCCTPNPTTGVFTPINVPAGGAEYFATHMKALGSEGHRHVRRQRRRLDRRQPAAVGPVPRRADDRVHELPRPRHDRRRQPRVRRGQGRATADAVRQPRVRRRRPERRHVVHACPARRLPSGRRLPGRHAVLRLRLPVPRCERDRHEHRQPAPARRTGS